jgi:hypothetical protein
VFEPVYKISCELERMLFSLGRSLISIEIDEKILFGPTLTPERLVDGCLELLGGYQLAPETRNELVTLARGEGEIQTGAEKFPQRVAQMLQSIVATTEYIFA